MLDEERDGEHRLSIEKCHGVAQSTYGNHPAGDVIDNVFPGCHTCNLATGTTDQLEWAEKKNPKMANRKVWMGVKALHGIWKERTFKKNVDGSWMTTAEGKMVLRDEVAALYG